MGVGSALLAGPRICGLVGVWRESQAERRERKTEACETFLRLVRLEGGRAGRGLGALVWVLESL